MEAWFALKKIKERKGRTISVVIGIALSFVVITISFYFDFAYRKFKATSENSIVYVTSRNEEQRVDITEIYINIDSSYDYSSIDEAQNEFAKEPTVLISYLQNDKRVKNIVIEYDTLFFNYSFEMFGKKEKMIPKMRGFDTNFDFFSGSLTDKLISENKEIMVAGRLPYKGEENVAIVSNCMLEYYDVTAEQAVGEKIKFTYADNEAEALIVGIYNEELSDRFWNVDEDMFKKQGMMTALSNDMLVSSDIVKKLIPDLKNANGSFIRVYANDNSSLEPLLDDIRCGFSIIASADGERLISEQILILFLQRMLKCVGILTVFVTLFMLFSTLYRNYEEQIETWDILEKLGSKKNSVAGIMMCEGVEYGIIGWISGSFFSFFICFVMGYLMLYGTPEFKSLKDILLPFNCFVYASAIGMGCILIFTGILAVFVNVKKNLSRRNL